MEIKKKKPLPDRQWHVVKFLREICGNPWVGALNRKVVNALIEKGLVKIDNDNNVRLTKLGKTIEL